MNDKLIGKIRKILAKAQDPSTTEQEANAFMAKANQMLLNHNLTMSTIETKEETKATIEKDCISFGKMYIEGNFWERTLTAVLCRANFCESVIHPANKKLSIIGREENVESVLYMYSVVSEIFRRLSRQRYNETKKQVLDEHDTGKFKRVELAKMLEQQQLLPYRTTFIQAYLKGAVMGLSEKMHLERLQAEANDRVEMAKKQQQGEDITGLIPLSSQLEVLQSKLMKENEEAKNLEWEDLGKARSMKVDPNSEATRQGYQDGKDTQIAKGITTSTQKTNLLQS